MSDWKYTFDPVSKENWLNQIEADLYPKGIESIQSEWWPGEPLFPAHHVEDRQEPIILPDSLFRRAPSIMEWIETKDNDAKTTNNKILDSLKFGTQSLVLKIDPEKSMPFRLWFAGVFSEMIDTSIALERETPEIINTLFEITPRNTLIRLTRKNIAQSSSVFFEPTQGSLDESAMSFRFVYPFHADGIWIQKTAETFRLIHEDATYWISQGLNPIDFLDNCILMFTPDTQYFKQLIQTRVLHLLWINIWNVITKSNRVSSAAYLEIHVMEDGKSDPDQFLIRLSVSALAASLTGVHSLCIHHLNKEGRPVYYDRVDRNIHHLLNMESEMYKGTDPLAGSCIIDFYTRKWTNDIWNILGLSL